MARFAILTGAMVLSLAAAGAAPFDKPADVKTVKLPKWDAYNTRAQPARTCTYYPGFVVKQTDMGEKGAAELSITPVKGAVPPCTEKISREHLLKTGEWAGYFLGAKGPYVFFDGDDGIDGGMPFAVYDAASGKKLFEDSRKGDGFDAISLTEGELVLQYRRVWNSRCTLYGIAKAACWTKVMAATGLTAAAKPDCDAAYRAEIKRDPAHAADIPTYPAVVAYSVEGRFAGGKLRMKPRPGPAACWLAD
jgi:hypothetical protein